jgi:hypothetical protein
MTNLSDKPVRWRVGLGALVASSLGCVSLEPLSSYSDGTRAPQESAPVTEPTPPAAEPEEEEPPLATSEAAVDSEGLPPDGELALQPAMAVEEPPALEPELSPSCTGPGEFANAQGTRCYLRSAANLGWSEAQTSCQTWGGGLVIVDSREEDAFLGTHLDVSFWIGASDLVQEGRWLWNGGAPLGFSNWAMGEPNDFQGREDCVVKTMPVGSWNDLPCRNLNAYVCERGPD